MPISRLLQNTAFEPAEIDALTEAFETICRALKLGKSKEALREKVAQKVIVFAELGERNPEKISQYVLKEMRCGSHSPARSVCRGAESETTPQKANIPFAT